jgi:hypothetical protein
MEITNSYLMWVGSEHYSGIDVYSDEAVTMGVSKRLPNAAVGKAMMEEGTVIFIAHDEGEHTECPACLGVIECPDCRKHNESARQLQTAIDKVKARFDDFETEAPKGQKRFVATREAKIAQLEAKCDACEGCEGKGTVKLGTGGTAELKDGTKWDYRKYTYWRNQPKKFDFRKEVTATDMCPECGGFGTIPVTKVFGMFVPERVEYILRGEDDDKVKELLEGTKHRILTGAEAESEAKRGCGYRKPGGVYVVTDPKADPAAAKAALKALVDKGVVEPEAAEIHGTFVRFTTPIHVSDVRRFRGIKRWSLDVDVEDEAEMAADALAS